MATDVILGIEDHRSNAYVPAGGACLSLEQVRGAGPAHLTSQLLAQSARNFFGELLFVLLSRESRSNPSEFELRRGALPSGGKLARSAAWAELGPSVSGNSASNGRVPEKVLQWGVPTSDALQAVVEGAAGGASMEIFVSPVSLLSDTAGLKSLSQVDRRKPEGWRTFARLALDLGIKPVRCFGAFDDREEGVQVFADPKTVSELYNFVTLIKASHEVI